MTFWLLIWIQKKKKNAHTAQVFFFINRKIQPRLWMHPDFLAKARTSSVILTPPKPRSSKSDSDSISDLNELAFIFVEIFALSSKRSQQRSEWAKGLEGYDFEEEEGGGGARNESTPQSWWVRVCLSSERSSFTPWDWASSFWPLGLDFYSFFRYILYFVLFFIFFKKMGKFVYLNHFLSSLS